MSPTRTIERRLPAASFRPDIRAALPGWLAARLIVVAALALAQLVELFHTGSRTSWQRFAARGLLGWDADWYQRIAAHGYGDLPTESVRFFPLFPVIGRVLGAGTWVGIGVVLLVVANVGALVAGALVHRLTLVSGGDPATAQRAATCFALAPPAFVAVMGYSESLAITLSLVFVIALLARRSRTAVVAGFLAGLARPSGIVLVVPALAVWVAEERRARWRLPVRTRARRAAVAAAPIAGTAVFLVWCQLVMGRWSLPYDLQAVPGLRGRTVDPLLTIGDAVVAVARVHFPASGHEITVIVAVALLAVGARRWPAAVSAWGAATVLVALTAERLGSLERYVWGSVVPVMTLAALGGRRFQRVLPVTLATGLAVLSVLALSGHYVP